MKIKKNYYKILFLIFILSIIMSCKDVYNFKNNPKVVNGVLNLSNWDIEKNGYLKLNGEWEFYHNKLLTPKNFSDNNEIDSKIFIQVPNSWQNIIKNSKYSYGTYRLKIITNNKSSKLALYFHYIYTAYKVYVNTDEIIKVGKISKNKNNAKPDFKVAFETFKNANKEIQIIIQVSNYHHRKIGIISPIFFGTNKNVMKLKEKNLSLDIFYFGSFFLISLFFLFIFFMRKKEVPFLFFSLMCIIVAFKILIINEIYIKEIISNFSWVLIIKLEYILNVMFSIFFNLFIYSLYKKVYPKLISYIFFISAFVVLLSMIIFPTSIISNLVFLYYIVFFLFCTFSIYLLIKVIQKKTIEAVYFFIGLFIFFITALNDILYNYQIIDTGEFLSLGLYTFIVFLGLLFSTRFTKSFNTAEYLSKNLQVEVNKKAKELKLENEKQKNFFVNLAHETKTPLTLISNYLDSYIKDTGSTKKIEIVKTNLDKLKNDMINLLDFEKLEKNKHFYDHSIEINFSEILNLKIPLFENLAKKNNQKIKYNIPNDIYIRCDIYAIDRVINNIVENSIKYTEQGGLIEINLKKSNDKKNIIFEVKDNGIGISKEQQENIFKPYYQISHTKRNLQGIGLGLNIVNNIIKQVDGKIKINSNLGEGTKISILLKMIKSNKANKDTHTFIKNNFYSKQKTIKQKEFDDSKKSIMIVEDNIDMLAFLQEELSDKYNIFIALDGKEALNKLSYINKPELIISDIMMDIMNGYDFLKRLNDNDIYKSIPFIFLTAKQSQIDKIIALKNGAIDFIKKPFSIDELKAKIASILKYNANQSNKFLNQAVNVLLNNFNNNSNSNFNNAAHKKLLIKYNISEREDEIISLLSGGFEYKEIAKKLKISKRTVENHVQNIYKKINVNNKVELINFFYNKN